MPGVLQAQCGTAVVARRELLRSGLPPGSINLAATQLPVERPTPRVQRWLASASSASVLALLPRSGASALGQSGHPAIESVPTIGVSSPHARCELTVDQA